MAVIAVVGYLGTRKLVQSPPATVLRGLGTLANSPLRLRQGAAATRTSSPESYAVPTHLADSKLADFAAMQRQVVPLPVKELTAVS